MRQFLAYCFFVLSFTSTSVLASKSVNVYIWGGEIPKRVIQDFEKKTGIGVNISTYDSNETMYAKLKASGKNYYDVIIPSGYYVERMRKQGMLTLLDYQRLPNLRNIDPRFQNSAYDPGNQYSVPILWGATGIFYNQSLVKEAPKIWQDLWQPQWRNQLMLLDDARDVFAISLMSLGFNPNDNSPEHIKEAYDHLLQLVPNIKLFASDSIQAIMIDEDAKAGLAWNADAFKAQAENKKVNFIYPKDGFLIWVDCLAIPKNPPHPDTAYQFINFMLRAESGAQLAKLEGVAITNSKSYALLPKALRENPIVYPSAETLKASYLQRDVGEKTIALYSQYWQRFKLMF